MLALNLVDVKITKIVISYSSDCFYQYKNFYLLFSRKVLIASGAVVDAQCGFHESALVVAAGQGHWQVVEVRGWLEIWLKLNPSMPFSFISYFVKENIQIPKAFFVVCVSSPRYSFRMELLWNCPI